MDLTPLFREPEHKPFLWKAGPAAALLIHGFPGTPAEMRPLAESLHSAGWTVHGLLLPGFGPQIETLAERRYSEWIAATRKAVTHLQREHRPVILVGHSMGAAIAIAVCAVQPAAGLVLLSPFLRLAEHPLQRAFWPILRLILRRVKPFQRLDFSDPHVRQEAAKFVPSVDLNDPQVQRTVRQMSVPIDIIDQLRRAGRAARRQASQVQAPTLVIQGLQDEVARASETRALLRHLPGMLCYREVAAGHNLLDPQRPPWPRVERAVLEFAAQIERGIA